MQQRALTSADALIAQGNEAESAGKLHEACERYREAVRVAPDYAKAHLNLGIGLEALGDVGGAIASHEAALRADPLQPFANYNLGRLIYLKGDTQRSEPLLRQALRSRPQFPEARIVLASILQAQGKHAAALLELEEALRLRPDDLAAMRRLAQSLAALDRLDDARTALARFLALAPQDEEARKELAGILARLWEAHFTRADLPRALAALESLLELRPDWSDALFNYGCVLRRLGRTPEAETAFRRAIEVDPEHAPAYRMLGSVLRDQCRTDEAAQLYHHARERLTEDFDLASAELYTLMGTDRLPADEFFARHTAFGAAIERAFPPRFQAPSATDPGRPLRVGYVSADFRYHVVTLFMLPVLERHNAQRIEVTCYSTTDNPDEYTRKVASLAHRWRDCSKSTDRELADRIHADAIDVLVDLSGHAGIPHLRVFAERPAPIQATWLGYLATTGMTRMDYRITDAVADPPGMTEAYHTEKLARLPHTQWCYRPFISMQATPTPPSTKNGRVTFGSFNQAAKLSRRTRRLWAELLGSVPGSRFLAVGIPPGRAQAELRSDLAAAGVAQERISLLPYVSLQEYFRCFGEVDIALDTAPYSGGTTTCDALWMGVPVLTAPGAWPASRSAASILTAAGLREWIAPTEQEYVRRGAAFAADTALLKQLRATLRARLQTSPLMDEGGFVADLEALYRTMWHSRCAAPGSG